MKPIYNFEKATVADFEADGLLREATKLHVLCCTLANGRRMSIRGDNHERIKAFFDYHIENEIPVVFHNAKTYDIPLAEKILGIDLSKLMVIDTLALSWYLNFDRNRHGLGTFHEDYGIEKPEVEDWEGLTYEEYEHRCSEDVRINVALWQDLKRRLVDIYTRAQAEIDAGNVGGKRISDDEVIYLDQFIGAPVEDVINRLLTFLMFKMDCAREQEEVGIELDVELAQSCFDRLSHQKEEKTVELSKAMPKKYNYKLVNKPKDLYKKDGSLSVAGKRWIELLVELKLPPNTVGPVKVIESVEDGNPGSVDQVKEWLHSLGWKPKTFKYVKDKATGKERMVEQVRDDKELCESVTDLIDKDPAVGILEGLTVISHRLGIFKAFLTHQVDGKLYAGIEGITNTFRFKHKNPIVNLPGIDKPWGKEVRSCLLPPKGCVWAGPDMVSLEDTTKRHYMQPLDPKYVEEMMQPGYDPHLNLAMFAGAVTQEQIDQHNAGTISLKGVRKKFKAANYSCVYGVGKAKLARAIDSTAKEAGELIEAYWKRNWAIREVSGKQKVKIVGSKMWLQNPVSGFWHSLRAEKDIFSTLNQSTGVYCFDTWLSYSRLLGLKVAATFHDEQLDPVEIGQEKVATELLKDAIGYANNKLKLNVKLDIDVQIGQNYGQVH